MSLIKQLTQSSRLRTPHLSDFLVTFATVSAQRYFIELAYNGGNYHGWQVQPNAVTVQELLNKALTTILRQPIETTGCGRTDTGVHATEFFAHFDIESIDHRPLSTGEIAKEKKLRTMDHEPWTKSLNALLPFDIAVKRIIPVHSDAHARFDATLRSYQYHLHFNKDPFKQGLSWLWRYPLNVEAMNQAAQIITTYTDFSCFSKAHTQVKTNNCKVTRAEWVEADGGLIFHISADRFLRNMVRAIVGTLILVGKGELKPEDVHAVIASKDRSSAGESVPACGLYLTEVKYPYLTTNVSKPENGRQ